MSTRLLIGLAIALLSAMSLAGCADPPGTDDSSEGAVEAPAPKQGANASVSESVLNPLRTRLAAPASQYPRTAEYEWRLCQDQGDALQKVSHRVFAKSPDVVYVERIDSGWAWRILFERGAIRCLYHDDGYGALWCEGPLWLAGQPPEVFLIENCLGLHHDIGGGLLADLGWMLLGAEVVANEETGGARRVTLETAAYGALVATFGPDEFRLERAQQPDGAADRTLVRYRRTESGPAWPPPEVSGFVSEFETAREAGKVRRLTGAPYETIFDLFEEDLRERDIPLASLEDVARRLGYLLPDGTAATVTKAYGIATDMPSRAVSLDVRAGGQTYLIHQQKPPILRVHLRPELVPRERKSGRYTVAEVRDPGAGSVSTYFLAEDVSLIVHGDHFDDTTLDALVLSLRRSE